MFTSTPRLNFVFDSDNALINEQSEKQRISESEEQCDTHADHGYRVKQTSHDEHFDLQHWNHFRLTCSTFQEFATQQTKSIAVPNAPIPINNATAIAVIPYSFHFDSDISIKG